MLKFRPALLLLFIFCITMAVSVYGESKSAEHADVSTASVKSAHIANTPVANPTTIAETLSLPSDFQQTAALYKLLTNSGIEELKRFVIEAQEIEDSNDRKTGLSIIYGRFADIDPEAALNHVIDADISDPRNIVWSIFFSWSKVDLDEAIEQCNDIPSPNHRRTCVQAILTAQRDKKLEEREEIAGRLGPEGASILVSLKSRRLGSLAETNPMAALEEVQAMKDQSQKSEFLYLIAQKWATVDPEAALEYSETMKAGLEKREFQASVMTGLAKYDPEGVLELIDSGVARTDQRHSMLYTALGTMSESNPEHALEEAQNLSNESERNQAIQIVLSHVSRYDAELSFAMLETIPDEQLIHIQNSHLLQQYVHSDPERALNWAKSHSENNPVLLNQVIGAIAQYEPERALELVTDLPDSPAKADFTKAALTTIARNDPYLAMSKLDSIPGGTAKLEVQNSIAAALFQDDRDSAMAWILSLDRQTQSRILIRLGPMIMNRDQEYAEQLTPLLPSNYVRNSWITSRIHQLSRAGDPIKTIEWLDQYRDEPKYNGWLNQLLGIVAMRGSVDDAIKLADTINDETQYDKAMLSIVNTWVVKDLHGAANWVQNESDASNLDVLIQTVTKEWLRNDLKSAQQWVMQFPQSDDRDTGLLALISAEYMSTQDANNILRKIFSPTKRDEALTQYVVRLARYDSGAARLFLKRQVILSDQRDRLNTLIDNTENGIEASEDGYSTSRR